MIISSAQIVCRSGDVSGNLSQVESLCRSAAAAGARFVLFGEAAITGYLLTPEVVGLALDRSGPEVKRLEQLSRKLGIGIAVGTFERFEGKPHVSHWVFLPDGRMIVQLKHALHEGELAAGFATGPRQREIFTFDGLRFALLICADGGINGIEDDLFKEKVQVTLRPCAGGGGREMMVDSPKDLKIPEVLENYIQSLSKVCFAGNSARNCIKYDCAIVAVNLAGDDGLQKYHPGHSIIIDHTGRVAALIPGEYVRDWLYPRFITAEIWE